MTALSGTGRGGTVPVPMVLSRVTRWVEHSQREKTEGLSAGRVKLVLAQALAGTVPGDSLVYDSGAQERGHRLA